MTNAEVAARYDIVTDKVLKRYWAHVAIHDPEPIPGEVFRVREARCPPGNVEAILTALADGPKSFAELHALGIGYGSLCGALCRLVKAGRITRIGYGVYQRTQKAAAA